MTTCSTTAGGSVAQSDVQGQFVLDGVPVGHVFLDADGSTATRPGVWTTLQFELFTVAGIDNVLDRPIFVLPLDVASGVMAGESEDATLTLPDLDGFSLLVPAGTATFPDGSSEGLISVTSVHADKIPMAPGAGMQPRFIVTVQPAGAHFDPPAAVTFPNVDALAPGTITEMFSFDHDLGAFVAIGTGTVSEDGTVIRSDPGFGIVKAGWHCAAPPGEDGDGGALEVEWQVPAMDETLFLCAGEEPPQMKQIFAVGTPPVDAAWTFEIFDAAVAELEPRGSAVCDGDDPVSECANAAVCLGELTAGEPGRTELLAKLTCCPSGNSSDAATAEVATVRADLQIQGLPEEDEPTPNEAFPGALIPYLDPSISDPQAFQPAALDLVIEPQGLDEGEVTLTINGPVRVWEDAGRTNEIFMPRTWNLETETLPETVYLEGTSIGGFGGVELTLEVEGCRDSAIGSVFGVDFGGIDICGDQIETWLLPNGLGDEIAGGLSMQVVDGDGGNASDVVTTEQRTAGRYTDDFNFTDLGRYVEFRFLETRWEINGAVSLARNATETHFMYFGELRHTQYNTPHETDPSCAGAAIDVCTRDPDPSQCDWQGGQMSGVFANQVAAEGSGTGSGQSANFGLVKQEFFCHQNGFPPPAAWQGTLLFERNTTANVPFCGAGSALDDNTVAVDDFYLEASAEGASPLADCGEIICIRHNNVGVRKTVTDRCEACNQGRVDNYSTSQECGILDYDNSAVTLRLYE